jgi:hypothetical protein
MRAAAVQLEVALGEEGVLVGGSFLCRDGDGEVRNAYLPAGPEGLLGRHAVGAAVCWEFMRSGTGSGSPLHSEQTPSVEDVPDESARCTRSDDGALWELQMSQGLQILGALLVLVPFASSQLGALSVGSAAYLGLNAAGSTLLAVVAFSSHQWGFLLLELTWAIVSCGGLLKRAPR